MRTPEELEQALMEEAKTKDRDVIVFGWGYTKGYQAALRALVEDLGKMLERMK